MSMQKINAAFENVVILALQLLMMFLIALSVFELLKLLIAAVGYHWFGVGASQMSSIDNVHDLQRALQRAFGGVLLVLLGLELFDTLRTYFNEHRLRLEIILIVAIIAAGRHIILLDFEHLDGLTLVGIAAIVLALTAGYFLVRRAATPASDSNGS